MNIVYRTYGDYLVVELKAPENYALSDARHFVSITYAGQVIGLKVINYPIIGSVELTKVDKDYPENHLAGAEFTVYKDVNLDGALDNADALIGTMKEYENGVYRMDGLRSGLYIVKETKAPKDSSWMKTAMRSLSPRMLQTTMF